MKLRILKKKHPSKLERIWIKHLIEWKQYDGEYKTIKRFYIESCKNILEYESLKINRIFTERN